MKKEFTSQDMIDFIKYYDEKSEKDCFDTYEEELNDFLSNRKTEKIGIFREVPSFSKNQIELNIETIDTAIAICDWDNYLKEKYQSPKDQITDLYWLKHILGKMK